MESQLVYSQSQWSLVLASFVFAAFALLGCFIYLQSSKSELSARFRPSGIVGSIVAFVAFSAYLLLIASWLTGFDYQAATDSYVRSDSVLQFNNGYRYVDWAVTVPLLCVEFIAVSALAGERAKKMRALWMPLAFVMVVTGYLGADTFGQSTAGHLVWGLISTVAFIPLYVGIVREGFTSGTALAHPAGAHVRNAALLLSFTWGVYPLAYIVPFFAADSSNWAVTRQLAFTFADVAAKVGYGMLIHAAAKARSAMDVAHAESAHPEDVYINSEKVAEAQPVLPSARIRGEFGLHLDGLNGDRVGAGGARAAGS